MLADDENVPSDDEESTSRESDQPETESIVVDMLDDSFIRGKVLLLPVMTGDCEVPQCCLCHAPTFEGEQLSNHLEFKLRLNSILSKNENTFGIVFDYSRGDAPYQMVCEDCLVSRSDSPDGQNVRESVFTIPFHQKSGTLDSSFPTNVIELFNSKSTRINDETVQFLRDRFTEQERLLR